MTSNQKALLDTIAVSEIGAALLAVSDNGYNVLQGATAAHPLLFVGYDDFPMSSDPRHLSTAAGRYQLLRRYHKPYLDLLKLKGFSPPVQDAIAIQQIRECRHALTDLEAGDFETVIKKIAHIWASLPGAGYGQHENKLVDLRAAYVTAGGVVVV